MKSRIGALLVSFGTFASLPLIGTLVARQQRPAHGRLSLSDFRDDMLIIEKIRRARITLIGNVALRVASVCFAVGLAGVILITPGDGAGPSTRVRNAQSKAVYLTPTPRPYTAVGVPLRTGTVTPTPLATDTTTPESTEPLPANVQTGGDQPSGPLHAPAGSIPENVNASPQFLVLHNQLEQSIDAYSASVGGVDVAIAVTDLQNGQTISVGGNVVHRTGCVINMFGLFAAVSEFQAGNASPASMAYSIKKGIGGSYPPEVKNFLQLIFGSYSDGVYRARDLMSSWGMSASYYDHIPYYGGEPYVPNILTPLETNAVFAKLWNGQLFDPYWTSYTIGVLRDSYWYVNYMIPGRLPSEATVAHKIGYYAEYDGWVNNDAAIVSFAGADGREKAYAITYMSQMANTEAIGANFASTLSRNVWDWMAAKYGLAGAPPTPTPQPTPVDTPTPAPTDTPSPSATPTASPTPEASATPPSTPPPTP